MFIMFIHILSLWDVITMYLIWSSQRVSQKMSTETGTVLLTSLVPPAAMGLIVGKKHLNGSRKGRWKHIFSADDGRGSSMKIPLHSWTSVRSCDWCMTHCCVLCAEWPRKRQVSGPWTHGTGVWKMVETKGFLERRWTRPPHPCTSLIFCRSVSLDNLQIAQTLSLFSVCALSHLACPRKISIAVWSNASAKAVGIQALSWTLRHHGDSKWEGRWLAAINWIQPLV
jgi:hypothetical protein